MEQRAAGVLGPVSTGAYAAFAYAILFVALMLLFGGAITASGIGIPGLLLYAAVTITEKTLIRKIGSLPDGFTAGAFFLATIAALAVSIGIAFL
ncbi:hypothetical protein ACFO4L_11450 [Bacillus daqingensis]|uniref:DUF350 domain-containing protein n=1 Tax=Bacillus daqingensis TaxID=872396 RepID=A0ABV9NYR6_9BACI